MKKIIISIASIGFVAAFAIGGTIAFYQDTETSEGNVFVAGSIDLTVDSSGFVYNDDPLTDGWEPVDLTEETFFNFEDIKPADHGWRNLSLHVAENDSWACLFVGNKVDDENIAIDPELDLGDSAIDPYGELDDNTEVFVWQDNDGDGLYYSANDDALIAEDGVTLATLNYVVIADSTYGAPLTNATTRQIYIAWCAGDQTVDGIAGTITCDGGGMSDIAQTDRFSADIMVYAVQTRHNEGFECNSEVVLPPNIPIFNFPPPPPLFPPTT